MKFQGWVSPQHKLFEFKKKAHRYCVCIPVINEGERIQKQLLRLKKYTKLVDVLIFDGGSNDNSLEEKFLKKCSVRAMLVKTEPGYQSTQLRMGLLYAMKQGYLGVIIVDGNGKDGLEQIPEFIKKLDLGFDYIQGSRFAKGGKAINTPFIRYFGNRLLISPILSIPARFWFTDVTNGFRACSRRYLLDPRLAPFRKVFVRYELLFYLPVRTKQIGFKITEIPVVRKYPKNQDVPTKIRSFNSHFDLLLTAMKVAFGVYNPST